MSRAPKKLRKRVEQCLRRAKIRRLEAVVVGERGPELWGGPGAPVPGQGRLYVWSAWLPDGQLFECVTNRPVPPAKRPYFPSLVNAIAGALHRGQPPGGWEVRHTPECMIVRDGCVRSPTVVVTDGAAGRAAAYAKQVSVARLAGVPIL
jgi:hypothetical protein